MVSPDNICIKCIISKEPGRSCGAPQAIPDADHFKLNDFENGWYIDVNQLCKQQNLCTKNADGTYNLQLVAEFTPQRWFSIGLIISGATLAGCLGYLGWYAIRRRKLRSAPRPLNLRGR